MTEKQISVRISATGGDKLQAQFQGIGKTGAAAFNQVGRAARQNAASLKNVGYQVQDVFVQVAAGTDVSRAFAQQLPQLLSGFGLMGVLAGTASAALIPLGAALFNAGESAKSFDEVLGNMNASVKALDEQATVFSLGGLTELQDKYGAINQEILTLIERQRQVAVTDALSQAKDAAAALNDEIYTLLGNDMSDVGEFLDIDPTVVIDGFRTVNPLVAEFMDGMTAISEARTFEEQAAAISAVLDIMEATNSTTNDLYGKLVNAESAIREMSAAGAGVNGWIGAAIGGASNLAAQLWNAAAGALAIGQNQIAGAAAASANYDKLTATGLTGPDAVRSTESFAGGQFTPVVMGAGLTNPVVRRGGGGGGGGGGGANDALKEQNDLMREAEKVIEGTRTEQEKFNIEVAKLDELLGKNLVTQQVYDRAINDLKEELVGANKAAEEFRESFKDTIAGVITGSMSGKEAVAGLLDKLAEMAAQQAAIGLFGGDSPGGLFGGALSSLFGSIFPSVPSFDGGGKTRSGPRSGGLDGKGGFMAMLHPNEVVDDLTRSGRGGNGNGHVTIRIESGPEFEPRIRSISGPVAAEVVQAYRQRALRDDVMAISRDPRKR